MSKLEIGVIVKGKDDLVEWDNEDDIYYVRRGNKCILYIDGEWSRRQSNLLNGLQRTPLCARDLFFKLKIHVSELEQMLETL